MSQIELNAASGASAQFKIQQAGSNKFTLGFENGTNEFHIVNGASFDANLRFSIDSSGNVTINGSSAAVDFIVESQNNSHMLLVDGSANRIGINESSPQEIVHISSDTSLGLRIENASANAGDPTVKFAKNGTVEFTIGLDETDSSFRISDTDGLGSSDVFVIDSNGDVGIGTSSPSYRLSVNSSADAAVGNFNCSTAFTSSGGILAVTNNNASTTGPLFIIHQESSSTAATAPFLKITKTSSNTEVFRVQYDGKVGIGVSSFDTNIGFQLVNSSSFQAKAHTWNTYSDISLKENIQNLKSGLPTILSLIPREFNYKSEKDVRKIGFVAQEVKSVLPEVVSGKDGEMSLSLGNIVPVLVKAVQEQQAIIENLKSVIGK